MKRFIVLILVMGMALSFSGVALAAEGSSGGYPDGPVQKAERGFNNILFGWTEIPKRIVDETKASNPVKGLVLGLFQGTCKAFARTASGAADVITFPIAPKGDYGKAAIIPDMPAAK
ncbi:MAG: exosortase system-associated protein, TIGR04073 family [Candidatus Omnitrophica bacterium]|nr:exosortase system-associated protein, TIGR04073 family [Candidatus Omnitrophota bacterium]